jgi:hypothetical protein
MDGYSNPSGFALTAADQLAFNQRVAALAHSLGLAVGLKNDLEQVAPLQPGFDFAVNESCREYDECAMVSPFIAAGKPVFHVEYATADCPTPPALRFSSILKKESLDAYRSTC